MRHIKISSVTSPRWRPMSLTNWSAFERDNQMASVKGTHSCHAVAFCNSTTVYCIHILLFSKCHWKHPCFLYPVSLIPQEPKQHLVKVKAQRWQLILVQYWDLVVSRLRTTRPILNRKTDRLQFTFWNLHIPSSSATTGIWMMSLSTLISPINPSEVMMIL